MDYALQLMLALGKAPVDEPVSLRRFCEESSISFLFLQKIAKQLREVGLIEAVRGSHGGYILKKQAADISLKDIIEAIDGPYGVTTCMRKNEPCGQSHVCTVREAMEQVNTHMVSYLEKTRLHDLLATVS